MSDRKPMDEEKLMGELRELKIRLAMANYAEIEGKALLEENDSLKKDDFYRLKKEIKAKFMKEFNRHYYKQRTKEFFNMCRKTFNKTAGILLIAMILISIPVFTVEAVRTKVLNFMLDIQDEYTQIRLQEKDSGNIVGNNLYINWEDAYVPKAIPEGYTVSSLTDNKNLKVIEYSNSDDSKIIFQQLSEGSSINIDTEDADKISKVTVQESEGMLVVKGDVVTVVWNNASYIFVLTVYKGGLSNEEVLDIAESVVLVK